MTRLQGCGTALVTPFTERGPVDFAALRALVDWQIAEGIDFLVACGSTGEAQTLDDAEREKVVASVVEVAGGRVPVMAGATSNDTARAVDETRRMCQIGADYVLSATPYYNKPTQEGLYRHFMAVADAATKPVCLYNIPGRTSVNLTPRIALKLAGHGNVMGIKEASGDLKQVMDLLAQRPEGFTVLSGDDWLTLPIITAGGDGLISVTSNEVPAAMTALVNLLLAGNLENARKWHYRLLPLMDANFLETNPAPVKAALHLMGRIQNVLRLPLIPVSESTRATLRSALAGAGVADV
ncbi:MAG TPA: 4-hydroxy-tetrahydrodipicolinate synthase [Gemmatimonadales bacterium]